MAEKSASILPHTIAPYFAIRDAARAIGALKRVFGATVSMPISEA